MIPPIAARPGPVASLDRLIDKLFAGSPLQLVRGDRLVLIGQVFDDDHMMELMLRIAPIYRQAGTYRRYHGVYGLDDTNSLLATVEMPTDAWVRDRRLLAASLVLRLRDRAQIKPQPFVHKLAHSADWLYLGHMVRDFDWLPDDRLSPTQVITGHGVVELLVHPATSRVMVAYLDAANDRQSILATLSDQNSDPHVLEAHWRYIAQSIEGSLLISGPHPCGPEIAISRINAFSIAVKSPVPYKHMHKHFDVRHQAPHGATRD